MEKQINSLEFQIKYLADQLNVTIEYCLQQYEQRKTSANTEAILGVAWQCLSQAKKIHRGEESVTMQLLNMTLNELVSFYVCKAADAYGMAKIEAIRLNPILEHQRKATKGATKYDEADIKLWNELADKLDPQRKLSKSKIAKFIVKQLQLPDGATQTIRKSIRL